MCWCNSQWSGFAIIEPYRSWVVEYSYGKTLNEKGEWINLWHWPIYRHADVRPFLKQLNKSK
jgi:hypothetical protein